MSVKKASGKVWRNVSSNIVITGGGTASKTQHYNLLKFMTAGEYSLTVSFAGPTCEVEVFAWGAGGGGGSPTTGGAGGYQYAKVLLINGVHNNLRIVVGSGGDFRAESAGPGTGTRYGRGGRINLGWGGTGGGFSGLFGTDSTWEMPLVIAGGGGGGGFDNTIGGAGGGTTGISGTGGSSGTGGTQTSGGYLGASWPGSSGNLHSNFLFGGHPWNEGDGGGGGAGGGGWFGGGPGSNSGGSGAGGGGSSGISSAHAYSASTEAGNGRVPGQSLNSLHPQGSGYGGLSRSNGTDGAVILRWIGGDSIWQPPVFATYSIPGTYTYTPSANEIYTIKVWGAAGGTGTQGSTVVHGGAGGFSTGQVTLLSGTTYNIVVGQGGPAGIGGAWTASGTHGGGGRAKSSNSDTGGAGGGFTGIFEGTVSQANAVLIAGGGGGGGLGDTNYKGGYGGGTTGGSSIRATGGSQIAGGVSSGGSAAASPGVALAGGDAATNWGAGGGGGYWGGAGGNESPGNLSGGGGGSSYVHPTKVTTGSTAAGNAMTPGGYSDENYLGEAGVPARSPSSIGGDGLLQMIGPLP